MVILGAETPLWLLFWEDLISFHGQWITPIKITNILVIILNRNSPIFSSYLGILNLFFRIISTQGLYDKNPILSECGRKLNYLFFPFLWLMLG